MTEETKVESMIHDDQTSKQKQAAERQKAWSKLTPQQQLESLDKRLGKGVGAAKQRAKIQALIDKKIRAPKTSP